MSDERSYERKVRDWAAHYALIVRKRGQVYGLYGVYSRKKVGDFKSIRAIKRRLLAFKSARELDKYILRDGERRPGA